jgi:hypothetical protein
MSTHTNALRAGSIQRGSKHVGNQKSLEQLRPSSGCCDAVGLCFRLATSGLASRTATGCLLRTTCQDSWRVFCRDQDFAPWSSSNIIASRDCPRQAETRAGRAFRAAQPRAGSDHSSTSYIPEKNMWALPSDPRPDSPGVRLLDPAKGYLLWNAGRRAGRIGWARRAQPQKPHGTPRPRPYSISTDPLFWGPRVRALLSESGVTREWGSIFGRTGHELQRNKRGKWRFPKCTVPVPFPSL